MQKNKRPSFSDVTVILPTLNERSNIAPLIEELCDRCVGLHILVVDDSSEDGTPEIVNGLSRKLPFVHLLSRRGKIRGLTASIIDALKNAQTEYLIVMDGDGQHPPEKIPALAELLKSGCDLAIACRDCVPSWSFSRQMLSRGADFLGRLHLALSGSASCSDIMSGFFGVRRDFAISCYERNQRRFVPDGYKFLFDLLKCCPKDTKLGEVGYVFGTRKGGTSKIGSRQCLAFVRSLLS